MPSTSSAGCAAFRALLAWMPSALRASSRMRFSKWHGLGNDYLLVERAELDVPLTPERVRRICDYHFGVGSDGILEVVEPETIDVAGEQVELTPVSVGNPHAVLRREPERDEVRRLGPLVENRDRFPER